MTYSTRFLAALLDTPEKIERVARAVGLSRVSVAKIASGERKVARNKAQAFAEEVTQISGQRVTPMSVMFGRPELPPEKRAKVERATAEFRSWMEMVEAESA